MHQNLFHASSNQFAQSCFSIQLSWKNLTLSLKCSEILSWNSMEKISGHPHRGIKLCTTVSTHNFIHLANIRTLSDFKPLILPMAKFEKRLGTVELIKSTLLNSVSKEREKIAGVPRHMEITSQLDKTDGIQGFQFGNQKENEKRSVKARL